MDIPKRLLIAEDNPALAGVIAFNLRHAGFEVVVRHNGLDAWQDAQAEDFGLIIADQQMPGMNGDELCAKIRELARTKDTPILMVTAKGLEMDLDRLKDELQVSAVLSKPFSPTELVARVQQLMSIPANCK